MNIKFHIFLLAGSQQILEWARSPDDAGLIARAIAEMENFCQNFGDKSYFVALKGGGAYHHNNDKNEFAGKLSSVSIGGILVGGKDVQAMVFKADQALYAVKAAGRGCVRLSRRVRHLPQLPPSIHLTVFCTS